MSTCRTTFILLVASLIWGNPEISRAAPQIGGCQIFPSDNIWNTRVDSLPVHANSAAFVSSIGATTSLHPDFGSDTNWGIPYVVVPANQALVSVSFDYWDECDPGPYPIPPNPPIEGGSASTGDRHILIVDAGQRKLYELYYAWPNANGTWQAGSGAIYDIAANSLRPDTWTSADAAGLPILPGLVRFDEVASGRIEHAIRFTAQNTRKAHVWPARHDASSLTGAQYPPMGARFRLRASFDDSAHSPAARTILVALKRYGIILADNGSNWFITGASDSRWNDDVLSELKRVKGADFEAVDTSSLMLSYDSAQVRYPAAVIKQCSVHGGTIQFTVTNLFPGASNAIERTSSLFSPDWQIVDRFLSESASTNWAAPLPGNLNQAYYRVRRL